MKKQNIAEEIKKLKRDNLLRELKTFSARDGARLTIGGKEYINFCSNDYLGLSMHPKIREAIKNGVDTYGAGSSASRLITGSFAPHALLEKKLAEFTSYDSVLLFNSGYVANSGVIPAIAGRGDVVFGDKLNHASIVDGCLLSKALFKRYRHLDMSQLEEQLGKSSNYDNRWIITESIFSMDGDIAPLDTIFGLAKKYDAKVYVDDAHGFGVFGETGKGVLEEFNLAGKADIYIGTLGKAAGLSGGFVGGSGDVITYLLNKAKTFIYSTSLPPALAVGGAVAVDILSNFSDERKEFKKGVKSFHSILCKFNFVTTGKSYIIPLVMGDAGSALSAGEVFKGEGFVLQAIRPPTVPDGSSRLRLTLSLGQTDSERERVLDIIGNNLSFFK